MGQINPALLGNMRPMGAPTSPMDQIAAQRAAAAQNGGMGKSQGAPPAATGYANPAAMIAQQRAAQASRPVPPALAALQQQSQQRQELMQAAIAQARSRPALQAQQAAAAQQAAQQAAQNNYGGWAGSQGHNPNDPYNTD